MNAGSSGAVASAPRLLLRLEGLALAAAATFFYWRYGGAWILFAVVFFAPDLTFLAYFFSSRAGAIAYNAVHTTLAPLLLLVAAAWFGTLLGEHVALIWLAHIGLDRALAFGLKYPAAFSDTHLGRIGR